MTIRQNDPRLALCAQFFVLFFMICKISSLNTQGHVCPRRRVVPDLKELPYGESFVYLATTISFTTEHRVQR